MSRRGGSRPGDPVGLCIIDKPAGCTSHDVVARVRRQLGTRRVGHAGTLDPMATGVLVVGVGAATKLLTFITGVDKEYEASIRFGVETDSLDADGAVVATHDMGTLDPDAVRRGAATLTGDLLQVPPMVSAIRVEGRRLHELAREGVEVERRPRPVSVSRYDVRPTEDPLVWDATVECSSGTYVRTLAADLGHGLGGGAHLASLRRTRVGPFLLAEATPIEELRLLAPIEAVRHLPRVAVRDGVEAAVRHGSVQALDELGVTGAGPWAVTDVGGELLAVYEPFRDGRAKPAIVLSTQVAG